MDHQANKDFYCLIRYLLVIFSISLIFTCNDSKTTSSSSQKSKQLKVPIVLDQGEVIVSMEDFAYLGKVDSLKVPFGIQYKWSEDKTAIVLKKRPDVPPMLSDIKFFSKGQPHAVLLYLPFAALDSIPIRKPVLSFVRQDYKQVIVAIENEANFVVPIWENIRIGYHKRRDKEEVFIKIPEQAFELEESMIQVWCSNKAGLSEVLEIPLENGKIIKEE